LVIKADFINGKYEAYEGNFLKAFRVLRAFAVKTLCLEKTPWKNATSN
jgi:hypothetical protein